MPDTAIRVENLSKQYRLGVRVAHYATLRDRLSEVFSASGRNLAAMVRPRAPTGGRPSGLRDDIFWALNGISFEVDRGQVLGIMGRNGAGKSTLLKVLSRITKPTSGRAEIHGRVGSLLEVGTGFHPELTGRENIYLNGAILGMRRAEIEHKFDEIVAFAEVEKFIDTPVKRYSSGIYVRLAFAVAAHLEPEILLVDEVLAVGDPAFQKKCLGKIGDVATQGRTVLFVSHNLGQMARLCATGIWLDRGQVAGSGEIGAVVAAYQSAAARPAPLAEPGRPATPGFKSWQLLRPAAGEHTLATAGPFTLEVSLQVRQPVTSGVYALMLRSDTGQTVSGWSLKGLVLAPGEHRVVHEFAGLPLRSGIYQWFASLWDGATKVDVAMLLPELNVVAREYSDMHPDWAGLLNAPCTITSQPAEPDTTLAGESLA